MKPNTIGILLASALTAAVIAFATVSVSSHRTSVPIDQTPQSGSITGPDIPSHYLNVSGVREWYYSMPMASASTTCSFRTPNATSTLNLATDNFTPGLGYSTSWLWGYSSSPNATTTSLGSLITVADAASDGTLVASSTKSSTDASKVVLGPNLYVNLKLSTSSTGATFAPQGVCKVKFQEI